MSCAPPAEGLGCAKPSPLSQIMDGGFDAFELVRITRSRSPGPSPIVFGAFMTAANETVDGRETLTAEPFLPRRAGPMPEGAASANARRRAGHPKS